jgi:hypothetical protein
MKYYNKLKEENDNFLAKYKQAKDRVEERRKNSKNKATSFELTFEDLLSKYKEKGYKTTDLSLKNKLFEPSALLLENNKIVPNYKILQNTATYTKDLSYLQRIGGSMTEKLLTDEKIISSKHSDNHPYPLITDIMIQPTSKKHLLNEIQANEKYIEEAERMIDLNEYRQIYDLHPNLDVKGSKINLI